MLIFFGHGVVFILFMKVCIVMGTTLGSVPINLCRIAARLEICTYHPSDDASLELKHVVEQ
jgi:hypothetical protein